LKKVSLAELEAEPRTNARASALAKYRFQKDEALLRLFGHNRSFPIVGKERLCHFFKKQLKVVFAKRKTTVG